MVASKGSVPDVEIQESRVLLKTPAVEIEQHRFRYRRGNGTFSEEMTRLTVNRPEVAACLLYEPAAKRLHFVRQFRYPAYAPQAEPPDNGWLIELVAGLVDPGETPEQCIIREVEEETGFVISGPRPIGRFFLSPGLSRERVHLFYAEVSPARRTPPAEGHIPGHYGIEDEDIETLSMSVPEFLARVERLEIADAKTIVAAEWLRREGL